MSADLRLLEKKTRVPATAVVDDYAVVHPSACVADGVRVGAFAVIGEGVELGEECLIHPHAVLTGPMRMGRGNEVFPFACLGGAPQDLRHAGEPTALVIGDGNRFREFVTVGRGTMHGGGTTHIGNDNLMMAYCHVGHDCRIGNRVVMANGTTLAGHVIVQDFAVFGGRVCVGSFLRIGESAMLAAGAMVERDVPPFSMVGGDRAVLKGVNRVGIGRREVCEVARREIRSIIKLLKSKDVLLNDIPALFEDRVLTPEANRLLCFVQEVQRGVTR